MKRTELSKLTDESTINRLIEERFLEWNEIHEKGKGGFESDGYILNYIRGEILQLRDRRDRLFGAPLVGQQSFFGCEVEEEKPVPKIMPMNWNAKGSLAMKTETIEQMMISALAIQNN